MTRRAALSLGLAVSILLGFSFLVRVVAEDAFINFRYAANLVDHGELVFNLGERVEGYTNPLWTLLLAAAYLLDIPLPAAAMWLGVLFAIGSLIYTYRFVAAYAPGVALIAPLLLASCAYHSLWAYLGLEPTAFGACIIAAFYYLDARTPASSAPKACAAAALAYLFRPEGGLVVVAVAVVLIRRHRTDLRTIRLPLAALGAAVLGHVLFRVVYYGDVVPNTFHAKAMVSAATIELGLTYLFEFALHAGGLVLLALGALYVAVTRTRPNVRTDSDRAALLVVYAHVSYVVLVGGDYMGASRFLVPYVPLLIVWGCRLAAGLLIASPTIARRGIATAMAVYLALSARGLVREITATVDEKVISPIGALERYVEDRLRVGPWLARHVDGPYTITGSAMGVIPWHLMHAHVIDARGLTNRSVARTAPIISIRPGHAKFATDEFLLAERPHLLMHRYAICKDRALAGSVRRLATPGYHAVCVAVAGMHDAEWFCFAKRDDVALDIVGLPPPGARLARIDASGQVTWSP